jgi:hyaluronan synthase
MGRAAYWVHAVKWVQSVASTSVVTWLVIGLPAVHALRWVRGGGTGALVADARLMPFTLGMLVVFSYVQLLRVLTVRRSDQRMLARVGWFLVLAPWAVLWQWSVLRAWRLWAIITCRRTSWGTRQEVEVEIGGDHEAVLADAALATVGWMHDETVVFARPRDWTAERV